MVTQPVSQPLHNGLEGRRYRIRIGLGERERGKLEEMGGMLNYVSWVVGVGAGLCELGPVTPTPGNRNPTMM